MADMQIRQASTQDLESIFEIEKRVGYSAWSESQLLDSFNNNDIQLLVDHNGLLAYAVFIQIVDEVELLNIAVHPEKQGYGYARHLLSYCLKNYAEQALECCFLEVAVNNDPALRLYEKLGFVVCGRRKAYYKSAQGDRIDAMLLKLDLKNL